MADTWTVLKLIQWTSDYFAKKNLDAPRLTAELLLAKVLKTTRVKLYMAFDQPLAKEELAAFRALIERRAAGEPTAYLLGAREFYGRPFAVDARVLVPRPETERLVELVLEAIPKDAPAKVVDLCTGTCCIAATIAAERPQAEVTAVELSPEAAAVARENLRALGLDTRVRLLEGDLFAPVGDARFDVVVSNPPYVAEGAMATLPAEVQREPRLALAAGPEGMDVLRRVAHAAREKLVPGGLLALEIGDDQRALVQTLLNGLGYEGVQVLQDWAAKDRVALARRRM